MDVHSRAEKDAPRLTAHRRAAPRRSRTVVAVAIAVLTAATAAQGAASKVTAGHSHTCALTTSGGVKCWGWNYYGQLGDGTTTQQRLTPVDASGLVSGVAAIVAGDFHTCALTTGSGMKCWGDNGNGQLGDGTTTDRRTPVDVSGLTSGVAAMTAGVDHTCALTTVGGVKCWGDNIYGQLGDGTTTRRLAPVDVSGLTSGVAAIAAGQNHTCALTTGGGIKCWGRNDGGQLGDGTTTQRLTPVDVSGLASGGAAIAVGEYHTCALTTGGGVKCWGRNASGQLGDGTTTQRLTPVNASGLTSGVAAIAASYSHTCALTTGGGAKCWGENGDGEVGDGTAVMKLTAVNVSGLTSGVAAITTGWAHTCAVTAGGGVRCWGLDSVGQLGDGTVPVSSLQVGDVAGLTTGVAAISAGEYHACALTTSGGIKCWGPNWHGEIGDGTTMQRLTAVDVTGLTSGAAAIAAGNDDTCALTTGGGMKCWGLNGNGQLGDGTTIQRLTPMNVSGLTSGVAALAATDSYTCALTTGGGVKCWGYNFFGQLGDGTTAQRLTPVDVSGLTSGAAAITAGYQHTCALTTGGGVKCWGRDGDGELGDGTTTTDRLTPVDVSGLTSGVAAITAGYTHTCALTTGGGVKCWGANFEGELGDGTTTERLTPVDVSGLTSGVAAIAAGEYHTCALTTGGGVKCWGANGSQQLGDGTTHGRLTPVDASGLTSGVVAIEAGVLHTCAVTAGGGAKCWGDDRYGQLGNGQASFYSLPVSTAGFPCGDGIVDPGETCDVGAANGTAGSCCDANCALRPATYACRAAAGPCDLAETCSGTSASCPPDAKSTAVCRAAAGDCDVAETCDGGNDSCPADGFAPSGTTCRAAAGACDLPETCNGSTTVCPGDSLSTAGTVCRSSVGLCDVAETCSGLSAACPGDTVLPSGSVCRLAAGLCDVSETCNGSSGICPNDAKSTSVCRPALVTCDVAETCDGSSNNCPGDGFASSTTVCRASAGVCDVTESCTGTSTVCPADAKSTAVCRSAAGACDAAETCDGITNACPPDLFQVGGFVCRATVGICDVAETCSGTSTTCPTNGFEPSTTVCRGASGGCDVAESCPGNSGTCPNDAVQPSGTVCRSATSTCDAAETCDGLTTICLPDTFAPPTTVCRPASTVCDLAESCTGVSTVCPTDLFAPATTSCRPAAGVCDVAESCDGSSNDCPGDAFAASTTLCRASAGTCDGAEFCPGTGPACPADAKSSAQCRASAGDCDVAETCDGSSNNCPADGFRTAGFVCRATAGTCDVAETCSGSSPACPADGFSASTVECRSSAGICDPAENCTGTGPACPPDAKSNAECRAVAGDCDVAESCDGTSNSCPPDVFAQDGTPCNDNNTCTASDTCQNGTCMGQAVSGCEDHYLCYKTYDSSSFQTIADVNLSDTFQSNANFDLVKPVDLCNPASASNGPILDAAVHERVYKLRGSTPFTRVTHVDTVNEDFGALMVDVVKPDLLFVPAAKSLVSPPAPLGPNTVDHHKCYRAVVSSGTARFQATTIVISDQFRTTSGQFDVKKVRHFCTPVDKNHEGITNASGYLMCYRTKPSRGVPKHQKVVPVFLRDQFGSSTASTITEGELCVPTVRVP